jgi:hypothetical protein
MPARRHLVEQDIQRALFEHIDRRGVPGLVAIHCPNGGWHLSTTSIDLYSLRA